MRASFVLVGALAALAVPACSPRDASSPHGGGEARFGKVLAAAVETEQSDSASADRYLAAVDEAVSDPDAPGAFALAVAALDALTSTVMPGLEGVGPTAVAFRSRDAMIATVKRLEHAWDRAAASQRRSASLTFIQGAVAMSLHQLALQAGDLRAAETWGYRRGCANVATLFGPLDVGSLRALEGPSIVPPTGPLPETLPGVAPFAPRAAPEVVRADTCQIDVNATSVLQGLRAVVVDFENPKAQRAHFALTTSAAAVLEVAGVPTVRRGYDAGGRPVMRLGSIDLPAGRVRAVVRFAQKNDGNMLEIDAFGEDGAPLTAHAPRRGDVAAATGGKTEAFGIVPVTTDADEVALAAAGLLGLGDARAAEHLLEVPAKGASAPGARPPWVDLVYARALDEADDEPENKVIERMRAAIDRVVAAWPTSWEARLRHARSTEHRKGAGDGLVDALHELEAHETGDKELPPDRMIFAYAALIAKRMQLFDIADDAYAAIGRVAPKSALVAGLDARLHPRSGPDLVKAACSGGTNRSELDCFEAHRDMGDRVGALEEIERLRRLRNAPEGLREAEMALRIADGDLRAALSVYDSMHPGERKLYEAVGYAAGREDRELASRRLKRDLTAARDAPFSIAAVERALGITPDPAPALEAEGRRLVLEDRKNQFLPGAATAVLKHVERFRIEDTGLVHFTVYDLRRVSGTTDVANGSASYVPTIDGRGSPRLLRRRIHKRDGRILEPDAATNAQQSSDLSQLETGDCIEQIHEGWALPGDSGQIVIDTPDLMPERTSVREAVIEVRRAASVPFDVWSHALFGKPDEHRDGAYIVTTWTMKDKAPRRIEDGVPRPERSVAVVLGTQTWSGIARAMEDNLRALEDSDPFVRRFALEAAGADTKPTVALLERVVAAVGKKVKVAAPADLSDIAAVFGGGSQRVTARTSIELGQGSRSWVVYRALAELGIKADIAVSETEPFSSSPTFPAHAGRFRHPLVIAHLPAPDGDVWIDADVEGPPLPPGRISPELRGRTAMLAATGKMITVNGAAGETGDHADLRLALDDKGDARGTFVIVLHGRAAQALADSFDTVVGSDRRELLRSVVLGWVPWADVDDVMVSSAAGSWEIVLRADIAVHGYARPEGKDGKVWTLPGLEPVHIVFPQRYVGTLASTYASRGARQSTLSIDAPLQYQFHRVVTLPPGAAVAREPSALDASDPNLVASRKVMTKGSTIEDQFSLNMPTGTIAADRYQAFVQKVQQIDDAFMIGTRVRVKP